MILTVCIIRTTYNFLDGSKNVFHQVRLFLFEVRFIVRVINYIHSNLICQQNDVKGFALYLNFVIHSNPRYKKYEFLILTSCNSHRSSRMVSGLCYWPFLCHCSIFYHRKRFRTGFLAIRKCCLRTCGLEECELNEKLTRLGKEILITALSTSNYWFPIATPFKEST